MKKVPQKRFQSFGGWSRRGLRTISNSFLQLDKIENSTFTKQIFPNKIFFLLKEFHMTTLFSFNNVIFGVSGVYNNFSSPPLLKIINKETKCAERNFNFTVLFAELVRVLGKKYQEWKKLLFEVQFFIFQFWLSWKMYKTPLWCL